jgi:hypothetical protein
MAEEFWLNDGKFLAREEPEGREDESGWEEYNDQGVV